MAATHCFYAFRRGQDEHLINIRLSVNGDINDVLVVDARQVGLSVSETAG